MKIPEQKVILCGEYGVGKSSLFRRFMSDSFTTATDRKSTMGLDHFSKVYDVSEKELKLQLWDTGGNDELRSSISKLFDQVWRELRASPAATTNTQKQQSSSSHLIIQTPSTSSPSTSSTLSPMQRMQKYFCKLTITFIMRCKRFC